MAQRLPVGAARDGKLAHAGSFGPNPPCDISTAAIEHLSSPITFHETDSNGSHNLVPCNGLSTSNNHISSHIGVEHFEATARHKNRLTEAEPTHGSEWVEQDEPGVYITLVSLPGGVKDLKRVRFSRKQFSEKQAEQWWAANRTRVYQQYKVPMVDKAGVGIGREGFAH